MYDKAYQNSKLKDFDEIERITYFFKNDKVKIVKLNHCLAESAPTEFDSIMQLSQDDDCFTITNKIPLKNAYLMTADDALIHS